MEMSAFFSLNTNLKLLKLAHKEATPMKRAQTLNHNNEREQKK